MLSAAPPVFLSWACWCSEEVAFRVQPADSAKTAGLVAAAAVAAAVGIVVGVAVGILDSVAVADTVDSAAAVDTADSAGLDSPAVVVEGAGPAYPAYYYQRLD